MPARARDAIAVAVLLAAAFAIGVAWGPLGPWVAPAVAFAAGLAVTAIYRLHPPHRADDLQSSLSEPQPPLLVRRD